MTWRLWLDRRPDSVCTYSNRWS